MMNNGLADELLDLIPASRPGLHNPWRDRCSLDAAPQAASDRRARLAMHLDCEPAQVLIGEACGFRGARFSGVPFTSERQLLEGVIPRIEPLQGRITSAPLSFAEPSATLVWKNLYALRIESNTVMWNALQMHPFHEGDSLTNRTPTTEELRLGEPALRRLLRAFPRARVIAVGNAASRALERLGVAPDVQVRHPANGGATKFATSLRSFINAPIEHRLKDLV